MVFCGKLRQVNAKDEPDMVITRAMNNALSWTFRQMQDYKTKEQLLTAYNLLQQAMYEAERQRQTEEIKALRL